MSQAQAQADACWHELVEQRLPASQESQAHALKAFVRVRALPNAAALLRALLCYVLSLTSLKQLSGWSRLVHVSTRVISAQAWHKRLRQAAPWLLWLGSELLRLRRPVDRFPLGQRILLVDATFLNEMGARGDRWRVHCASDLRQSEWAWVQVTDRSVGERLAPVPIQPGDILVGEKAYSKAPQRLAVDEAGGFSLTRFRPWHLAVSASQAPADTPEFRVDVRAWLTGLRPGSDERQGVVISAGKPVPVRLIAVVLPDQQAEARREHARRAAREKGRKLSEPSLFFAGFHLLVTPLSPMPWSLELILALYQARWQVEILFKRIKQVLDTHRLPCRCPHSAQAMMAALLVAWLLIEDEASELRRQITDAEPLALPTSLWQLNQWGKAGQQQVVSGWWSPAQLRAQVPARRRLYCEKRQRPRLEHQRRGSFHAFVWGEPDLVSLFDCSDALS
jgi:hypothetical protein